MQTEWASWYTQSSFKYANKLVLINSFRKIHRVNCSHEQFRYENIRLHANDTYTNIVCVSKTLLLTVYSILSYDVVVLYVKFCVHLRVEVKMEGLSIVSAGICSTRIRILSQHVKSNARIFVGTTRHGIKMVNLWSRITTQEEWWRTI